MSDPVKLVEDTWAIASTVPGVMEKFYERLFTLKPEYKTTLFARTTVKAQTKMLASMLDTAVKNLRKKDVLVPVLLDLGMRHCRYGCRPEHYPAVGEALLWTLEHFLKEKFTPEVKAAWVDVYTTVQTVMTSQCETAEGKRLLSEYEAKYGTVPSSSASQWCGVNKNALVALVVVPVVAAIWYLRSSGNK